ncbi:hypothetical protein BO78DRAFT_170548 [Aspergillus sclerotiicarbonarius CBS 121057]|uniref:Uncharacterized protein n=1 Tax=Aspergillus sclerotiicarbonarius (strain CBS 121057 / IBT 28362) TaxID=1448318 RepID=A0A319E331_ASPSB|nr:hypothetical protein BO78DRAFT_170548 [Aspergillus sclerotiicarbonarius CBS 121057]
MAQLTLSWFVHAHEETQSRGQPYIDHIIHPRSSSPGRQPISQPFASFDAFPISRLLISGDLSLWSRSGEVVKEWLDVKIRVPRSPRVQSDKSSWRMLETAVMPGVHLARLQLLPFLGSGLSWVDQDILVGQPIITPHCVIGGFLAIKFTWVRAPRAFLHG